MKLHLEDNIAEGTPEELVKYLRLVEEGDKPKVPLFTYGNAHRPDEDALKSLIGSLKEADSYTDSTEISTEEAEEPSAEFQVGDKVRVLNSAWGAEGVYTVTKVLEDDMVLVAGTNKDGIYLTQWSNHASNLEKVEGETASTELKVGDKVKVLVGACGAEGEATVTAVFEGGRVEIAGTDKHGNFLPNWSSHVTLLLKIEEDEDLEPEEAEEILGYRYWYLEGTNFNKFVVLEATIDGYFEDSTGKRYTHQAVSGHVKPVDREDAYVRFDDAEHEGSLLKYYPTLDMFDAE